MRSAHCGGDADSFLIGRLLGAEPVPEEKEAARFMGPIDQFGPYWEEMLRCTRCGFCQAACPIYDTLRTESSVARGKVQLLLAVNNGTLEATETITGHIYRCLDCRLCQQTCPGGVRTDEIFQGARDWLAHTDLFPLPLQELRRRVGETYNIVGEANAHRTMWRENLPEVSEALDEADVVFFTGCVSSLYPMVYGIPQSMAGLLERAGIRYLTLNGEEWCCGYPLRMAGLEIDDLITHNMSVVEGVGARWLVTTCPSCYKTWRSDYPAGSFEVVHSTTFTLRLLEEGRLRPQQAPAIRRDRGREGPLRVTYHDPCDLGRKSGVYDPPRKVLARIPGIELVEMPANRANAQCCGGGGNLESLDASLSAAIADRRLAQAGSVEAEVIVTSCQQCQRTLGASARRNRVRIPVLDVAQILALSLHGGS